MLLSLLEGAVGRWAKTKINRDICRCPAPDYAPTCNILAPTRGARSHSTNINTEETSYMTCHLLCSTEQKNMIYSHHHRTFNKQHLTLVMPIYETNSYTMEYVKQY